MWLKELWFRELPKKCPLCESAIRNYFWHIYRKHRKEDIVKAYLKCMNLSKGDIFE